MGIVLSLFPRLRAASMFSLSADPIDRNELIKSLKNDSAGALVTFEGWIRDHNQGKAVNSLEYQVYEVLAQKEGQKILHEAMHKFNLHQVLCQHRYGHLYLGDIAVWIGAIASHRDDAFKATRYIIDEIKLRLPIWKKEHYQNQKPEWVFCKDHHTHVHFTEEDYYKKQKAVVSQESLKKSHVLVVGAGGLGCPVLTSLTSAGVGHIEIVDFDTVSISNLHRQPLFSPEVVGEKKALIAQKRLASLNPFIHVHARDLEVSFENVEQLIQGKDLILDCTDNLRTKFLLHDACFKTGTPLISASIYRFEGYIRTFVPQNDSGCLRCLQAATPDDEFIGNCNDFGVLGASVNTLGSIQASEALAFLQTKTNATIKETFYLNLQSLHTYKIKNYKERSCLCCTGQLEISPLFQQDQELEITSEEINESQMLLVDIRELEDTDLEKYHHDTRKIVLYCHRGVRSRKLAREQREKGHTHFFSLKGGACSL